MGRYAFEARVDQTEVRAGRGVVLTLEARGAGNVEQLALPEVDAIDGFRVFPPTEQTELGSSSERLEGAKSLEILLTPERAGALTIPSLTLWTFDPEAESYRPKRTEPITINVMGASAAAPPVAPSPSPSPPSAEDAPSTPALSPVVVRPALRADLERLPPLAMAAALVAPWLLLLLVRVVRSRRPRAARAEAPSVRGALERARRAAGAGEAEAWAHLAEAVEAQAGTRDREEVARWAGARAQPLLRALDQADALSFAAALVERPSPQDVEAAAAALESGG